MSNCRRVNTGGRRTKKHEQHDPGVSVCTLALPSGDIRFGSPFRARRSVRDDDGRDAAADGPATTTLSSAYPSLSLASAKRRFCSSAAETMTISLRCTAEFRDRSPGPRD